MWELEDHRESFLALSLTCGTPGGKDCSFSCRIGVTLSGLTLFRGMKSGLFQSATNHLYHGVVQGHRGTCEQEKYADLDVIGKFSFQF